MNSVENLHSADGSFLGFLYQIERAMEWLSSSNLEAVVGVEVDDDITVKLSAGDNIQTIYEQSKHSISKKIPYSDNSEDVWKTLSIWVEAVQSGRFNVKHSIFSFLSNKKIPSNRLIVMLDRERLNNPENLGQANQSIRALAQNLIERAGKLPKSLKKYGQVILECPLEMLIQIVDKITIMDMHYTHNSHNAKLKLRNNLSMSEDIPFDHMYKALFGYVADTLIMQWRDRQPGWISVKAFNQQYTQLLTDFKKKSFFEQTVDSLPVGNMDIERNRGKLFVEQLGYIGCNEEEIIEAIHDFVRAASERSRFANDGEISEQKFNNYFDDLISHWKSISRPIFKFAQDKDHKKVGYEVYYKSLLYKGRLNNYEPEQSYTHKGSYHYLADETQLGWHPNWKSLIDKPDEIK
ncbi:ABC-three component system protein [Pedobacter heparinus]|uniref:ABC-three component system protein n=1 Tax=Pedobacter heparinus TaxID=984 RepID=UPI00293097D7|nr:ABC-three component system protein [Pedobacter heparinus]